VTWRKTAASRLPCVASDLDADAFAQACRVAIRCWGIIRVSDKDAKAGTAAATSAAASVTAGTPITASSAVSRAPEAAHSAEASGSTRAAGGPDSSITRVASARADDTHIFQERTSVGSRQQADHNTDRRTTTAATSSARRRTTRATTAATSGSRH
jgi:hypothetical protein